MSNFNIAIIGASGGIGSALTTLLAKNQSSTIYAFSRHSIHPEHDNVHWAAIDFNQEETISQAAELTARSGTLDLVIVATGILHDETTLPEKSLKNLSAENFQKSFLINTIGPALVAKHFTPKLHKNQHSVFAALSARVGSISDNQLGGWHAYRASKAALNMLIKTTSIEINRRQKKAIIVGLHPGTVDSKLSQPFQKNVPKEKLFTPEYSAKKLMAVIRDIKKEDSGKIFAWDGKEIPF